MLVLAFVCSIPALAQDITSGTVTGTVLDEKGAVVPGVEILSHSLEPVGLA